MRQQCQRAVLKVQLFSQLNRKTVLFLNFPKSFVNTQIVVKLKDHGDITQHWGKKTADVSEMC